MKKLVLVMMLLLLCVSGCNKKDDPIELFLKAMQTTSETMNWTMEGDMNFTLAMTGMSVSGTGDFLIELDYAGSQPVMGMEFVMTMLGQKTKMRNYIYEGIMYTDVDGAVTAEPIGDIDSASAFVVNKETVAAAKVFLVNPKLTVEGSNKRVEFEMDFNTVLELMKFLNAELTDDFAELEKIFSEYLTVDKITMTTVINAEGYIKSIDFFMSLTVMMEGTPVTMEMTIGGEYRKIGTTEVTVPEDIQSGNYLLDASGIK